MVSVTDLNSVDAYGLPVGIQGQHPDELYAAVGRVLCVCAVLEDQVTTLRDTLAGASQGQFTQQPVKAQIDSAGTLSRRLPAAAASVIAVSLTRRATRSRAATISRTVRFRLSRTAASGVTGRLVTGR